MTIHKFAVVVDGEVAGTLAMSSESGIPAVQRMIPALSSDPKIIICPEEVEFGWTHDGTNFIPPAL